MQIGEGRLRRVLCVLAILAAKVTLFSSQVYAQDSADAAAQANNPLANFTAFNLQNYYVDELTGPSENDANSFILRYAQPVQLGETNWLIRASLPFNSFPVGDGGSTVDGVGDFDIFAAYQIDLQRPGVSFAIGPSIVAPTASDDRLGSDQWQLGLANVYFNAKSAIWQYGYLLIWRSGVGSTNDRERVNTAALQPILFRQLGDGWYTGGAPIWTANLENGDYSVPLGLRVGKVWVNGKTVFNVFVEPQWSVADSGPGQPKRQVFFALNMQFQ
ncbi:hypothetical protein [Ruegeria lacuscaerulensis]|uniref:hypothetical protein n=1 Tax=Ruegeria lacuscaerulensis TaxID=55218 RepID=UPI001BE410A0|nr:hypothetical protein [Ruegeria lacuscaerulensis]